MSERQHYEQPQGELHGEWKRVSTQKSYAWTLIIAAVAFEYLNVSAIDEPYSYKLSMATFFALIGGAIWLWEIREKAKLTRRSMENTEKLDRF